jgi:thiol-disulfide isomerase/thioredoxin
LPAQAAGKFYTQQEFDTLNAEGKTIVVHVHADWCGICKAQDVEVNAAMRSPAFQEVVFFEVNFDSQRKAVKFFHSKAQSVLIIFKQGKEIDRAIGIRDPGELQTFLRQALP